MLHFFTRVGGVVFCYCYFYHSYCLLFADERRDAVFLDSSFHLHFIVESFNAQEQQVVHELSERDFLPLMKEDVFASLMIKHLIPSDVYCQLSPRLVVGFDSKTIVLCVCV